MGIKTYKKLTSNPLGLGMGLVVSGETFTDKDFDEVNKAKLKGAIRVGLVKEIDALAETTDKSNNLDNEVEKLTEELERITQERDNALAELSNLKGGDKDAWITMSKEELAEAYTVPELKAIVKEMDIEGVRAARNATEAQVIDIILEHREALTDIEGPKA